MLRTLLVGILAVSAVAACSGKSDAPAAQPGVSAGKVVELTGKVTATRGTDVRTLTEGGEISSDDVIDTAADSHIVIQLAHNNARWDLGPNKHGKVGESLAWTAAKVDRPAAAVKEETSTAGRYADKNAATTDTTTREKADSDPEMQPKGGKAPEPTAVAVHPPSAGPGAGSAAQPSPPPPPPPPPPAITTESSRGPTVAAADEAPAKITKAEPKAASKTESSKQRPAATEDKLDELGASVSNKKPGGGRSGGGDSFGVGVGGGLDAGPKDSGDSPERALQLEMRKVFVKERLAIAACVEAPTERLIVTITVKSGIYTITSTDPAATDKTRACLAKIAKRQKAKTKVDAAVTTKMTFAK